jgi:hypothetical protein
MEHTAKHRYSRGVRLVVGATVLSAFVASVAGSAITAMPETDSRASRPAAVTATLTEGYVNEWAAGDAAVARYLAQQTAKPRATTQPAVALQLLPDLVDPSVRRLFACGFAAGSFGIAPELTSAGGPGTCGASG